MENSEFRTQDQNSGKQFQTNKGSAEVNSTLTFLNTFPIANVNKEHWLTFEVFYLTVRSQDEFKQKTALRAHHQNQFCDYSNFTLFRFLAIAPMLLTA